MTKTEPTCQVCGKPVHSLLCGNCKTRLSPGQTGDLKAIWKTIARLGDDRRKYPDGGDGSGGSSGPGRAHVVGDSTAVAGCPVFAVGGDSFNFRRPFGTCAKSDEYYTPASALDPLLPYLPKGKVVWEGAWGQGHLARALRQPGFKVVGHAKLDFLTEQPTRWDMLVANPPYSIKDRFLERAYQLGKPFAFLMPLDALGGLFRNALFREHGLELLIPSQRINYILPEISANACNFHSAWFCWKLDLPQQLNFIETGWNGRTES